MATPEQIRAAVDVRVDAYARNDRDAFLALWAPDGVLEDPVGTPEHQGIEALGAFWDTARELADRIVLKPQQVIVAGSEAAMVFDIHAEVGGNEMVMHAVDVMRCDDDGRLVSVRAYWEMGL
ncbi:MAG: nuclear transport factor 2 family protein [Acidimicrobiia bacterium]